MNDQNHAWPFAWTFPSYALALRNSITQRDGRVLLDDDIRFMAPEVAPGDQRLALFTDSHLAQKFRDDVAPHRDLVLFNIPDAQALSRLLSRCLGKYESLVVDPNPQTRVARHVDCRELLDEIQGWLG